MATFTKKILQEGSGAVPAPGQTVTVHALGQQLDGTNKVKFWSTKDPGQKPFSYVSGKKKVITGWDDGVGTMKLGEKAELTIPGEFGYGAKGFPAWGIKPNATLVFEIELLKIE
mmetsp:Transcript_22415/g.37972  ORF Transcript_22415/g.37972 Transcript_22415/m.37972 type:complete len:114 (-) Transcript_22415:29-370(-)|eukprot:CAMPEP_0168593844 /NCGR_PEP_ID=MMETSP0420-20121227/8550_1 /TAXON_ID=498008 /ORGANISM="Pessonella sp." /LENGTH=113 /DNA_ID=CAMNT_0008630061 /DNA_START=78 /DNA_END=419 /DNA_ORIENTATION=+